MQNNIFGYSRGNQKNRQNSPSEMSRWIDDIARHGRKACK